MVKEHFSWFLPTVVRIQRILPLFYLTANLFAMTIVDDILVKTNF